MLLQWKAAAAAAAAASAAASPQCGQRAPRRVATAVPGAARRHGPRRAAAAAAASGARRTLASPRRASLPPACSYTCSLSMLIAYIRNWMVYIWTCITATVSTRIQHALRLFGDADNVCHLYYDLCVDCSLARKRQDVLKYRKLCRRCSTDAAAAAGLAKRQHACRRFPTPLIAELLPA
ncbi:uncharacterized protein LOC126335873 [Schistocerca gregaria]|uniref:uncharacterized protein LOC126335873 n=1 Tax=Schistocerca gregaria TaxID=7010 RepID=UPI00211E01DC|nr:uncharacterized protein LOC126335873 [Schistocerca gregaria]